MLLCDPCSQTKLNHPFAVQHADLRVTEMPVDLQAADAVIRFKCSECGALWKYTKNASDPREAGFSRV